MLTNLVYRHRLPVLNADGQVMPCSKSLGVVELWQRFKHSRWARWAMRELSRRLPPAATGAEGISLPV